MQKKGFTLVELLVVVVVIATLMSITFRIANAGSDSQARNATVNKIQRIENCLSGYYAAFGSYPPVRLHGSRNFRYQVNAQGIQQVGKDGGGGSGGSFEPLLDWRCVRAACRSQPLGMEYPFTSNRRDYIQAISDTLMARHNSNDPRYAKYKENQSLGAGFFAFSRLSDCNSSDRRNGYYWTDTQIFKFGLLSYLLPRYLIMLGNQNDDSMYDNLEQWTKNNQLPCQYDTGMPYEKWRDVNQDVRNNPWKIAVMPSQAVCARWLPNLSGIMSGGMSSSGSGMSLYGSYISGGGMVGIDSWGFIPYSNSNSQGGKGGYSQQYILDGFTIVDGWEQEMYYYSPAPYQTYCIWSSGPNKKTFPPWVTNEEFRDLTTTERQQATEWRADDIVQMSY